MIPYDYRNTLCERKIFYVNSTTAASSGWHTYVIPQYASMIHILCIAGGGAGGSGVVGATSTAAGGGGGGSSGQTSVIMPTLRLPSTIFVNVGEGGIAGAGNASRVSVYPNSTANHCIALANGGGAGGNASGATAGTAGAAGAVATAATMPIGAQFSNRLDGQAGTAGGTTGAPSNVTLPLTGLIVTGGAGGGGLGGGGSTGSSGGSFVTPDSGLFFPAQSGGTGGTNTVTPPTRGSNGISLLNGFTFFYGGTGGGSTHGSATGAGLVQAAGGDGSYGCGGGGMGGALTGSTAGVQSIGGDGIVFITVW